MPSSSSHIPLLILAIGMPVAAVVDEGQACCGECWCITDYTIDSNGNAVPGECPDRTTLFPQLYTEDMVNDFRNKTLVDADGNVVDNLYTLDCDPYEGVSRRNDYAPYNGCELTPPQHFDSVVTQGYDDAVCGFKYPDFSVSGNCDVYTYQTYASEEEAVADGAWVTHTTQCGACSTAQDLAAYLESPDLTTVGAICGAFVATNFDKAIDCYMEHAGFTYTCARVWASNALQDLNHCLIQCINSVGDPEQGPAPQCELNSCLECDAQKGTPTFNAYAGRTRRDSGIWSATARSCSEMENVQQNTCPPLIELADEPICEEQQVCISPNPLLNLPSCAPTQAPSHLRGRV